LFYFTTRGEKNKLEEQGARVIDVSSRAPEPFCCLSPFYPHGKIPIPGIKGEFADSVEGVWQGLKIINDKIDRTRFQGPGRKRRGEPKGHLYGERVINYIQARKLIYLPLYRWMIYNSPLARQTALDLLKQAQNQDIYLYDFETNPDIENLDKPLAHAAVLAQILNENLATLRQYREDKGFKQEYDENDKGQPKYLLADLIIKGGYS